MKDQIRSEFRKLRTTRSVWGLFAGLLALTGLATWGILANIEVGAAVALTSLPVFLELMVIVPVFVLVLGIRAYTDEARHGSIVPSLLANPDRRRLVGAKLVVIGAAASIFALAATALASGISVAWLAAGGVTVTAGAGALAVLAAKTVAIGAAWSAIGLGVGLLVLHQVAAIVGSLLWVLVGEGLVGIVAPQVAQYLPGQAANAALGMSAGDAVMVAPIVGAGLLAGWVVLSLGAGTRALVRRDIA
ncbi:MAG: ABC transporter permease subunit [Actinomycetota bacterium]